MFPYHLIPNLFAYFFFFHSRDPYSLFLKLKELLGAKIAECKEIQNQALN